MRQNNFCPKIKRFWSQKEQFFVAITVLVPKKVFGTKILFFETNEISFFTKKISLQKILFNPNFEFVCRKKKNFRGKKTLLSKEKFFFTGKFFRLEHRNSKAVPPSESLKFLHLQNYAITA